MSCSFARQVGGYLLLGFIFVTSSKAQLLDTAEEADRLGDAAVAGDFNGDGFADLAIGVPGEEIDGLVDAGAVHVLYGSASGLTETDMQFWTQNDRGTPNAAGAGDGVGTSLVAGDFNGDGFDDLAIGVPGETLNGANEAGGVMVLFGGARGLDTSGSQLLSQAMAGMADQPENNDRFGAAVSTGDFDGDGLVDLAVGIPGENVGTVVGAGAVQIFFGDAGGFTAQNGLFLHQDLSGMPDTAEGGDGFGASLATGNFNGDAFGDLAIGVSEEDLGSTLDAGAVHVLNGSAQGPQATGSLLLHQNETGVEGDAAAFEQFGWALAAGDFNNDGRDDLAIGIPFEAGSALAAGSIQVVYGSASGLNIATDEIWNQDTPELNATAGAGDLFGYALATGDVDGDGFVDLAVGTPGKASFSFVEAGAVYILSGSGTGLAGAGFWQQGDGGTDDETEGGDFTGAALAAGDFNNDGRADLAVGSPLEDRGDTEDSGRVLVRFGAASGLDDAISSAWSQNSLPQQPELIIPESGATVVIGGADAPVDPETPFSIVWSLSDDADGHTVTYYWQLSLTPTFNILPKNVALGVATRYETTIGEIGRMLGAIGILADSSFTFYHRVIATDGRGQRVGEASAVTFVRGQIVANEAGETPLVFALEQNYPNPFNHSTTITYALPAAGTVRLDLYNQLGQRVRTAVDQAQAPGRYTVTVDLSDQPSGLYLYRIDVEGRQEVRTMVLVK
ncbi:MAG: FG-GAP-like repeat-containing protein [Rhodothermales bacterium]|nr:FG-GAP-like repeat-containing protein [Rhodothermales bacterium]